MSKEILEKILTVINKNLEIKIVEKKTPARYYDKEWEVFTKWGKKWYEIGTFGLYSKRALENYKIEYDVYNFGIGLERFIQVCEDEKDIRKILFWQRYFDLSDEELAKNITYENPKTEYGKFLEKILLKKALELKDKIGPFEELIYEDKKLKIYFLEPDKNKKFLGPAALNKIYVSNGNIISTTKDLKNGVYLGSYLEFIIKKFVKEIEKGNVEYFKVRWVNGASDLFIEIPNKVLKYINRKGKKIDIKGPVFFDAKVKYLNRS